MNVNICISSELESTFFEILNLRKSNIIGCIYNHPSLDLKTIIANYLNNLPDKVSSDQKSAFLLGDFNIEAREPQNSLVGL